MPSIEVLRMLARDLYGWLLRPRVRLTVTGFLLLISGALFVTSSVWTLPLVIGGTLMVAIAWVGQRLEGHFHVEWGLDGTQVHCGAKIKPHAALVARSASAAPASAANVVSAPAAEIPDADVVDGDAYTVETEVAQLEALVAAAGRVAKLAETADVR